MVQAIINISDEANRILNMVKAKHCLKDKSEAINFMAKEYGETVLEPEIRPEYMKKALRAMRGKVINVGTIENLRKRYEKDFRKIRVKK